MNAKQNARMAKAKAYYQKEVEEIKANGEKRKEKIRAEFSSGDPKVLKSELSVADYETKSALFDAKSRYNHEIDNSSMPRAVITMRSINARLLRTRHMLTMYRRTES